MTLPTVQCSLGTEKRKSLRIFFLLKNVFVKNYLIRKHKKYGCLILFRGSVPILIIPDPDQVISGSKVSNCYIWIKNKFISIRNICCISMMNNGRVTGLPFFSLILKTIYNSHRTNKPIQTQFLYYMIDGGGL